MKKMLFAIGLGLMSGSLWAACQGPYCYDDKSAQINATVQLAGPVALPSMTSATIRLRTPLSVGELYYCNDCATATNGGFLCISTGTAVGGFGLVSSTGTKCS